MLRKITDFILLSMGITPKGAEPAQDKWAEARRRAGEGDRTDHPAHADHAHSPHQPPPPQSTKGR